MPKKKMKPMRIVNLQAENIKRLVAIDITPEGNLVQITGKNGAGKTSVLDAIWWCLTGGRGIQSKPIRNGVDMAIITLDMGELTVTRRFKRKENDEYTTEIKVESQEGARFPSPQAMLDGLVGDLSMDPLEFAHMKPGEQYDALRGFVPDFNFDVWESENEGMRENRRTFKRRAADARAAADAIEIPDGASPDVIDEAALTQELADAGTHNADIQTRRMNRKNLDELADRRQLEADELRQKADAMEEDITVMRAEADTKEKMATDDRAKLVAAGPLPEPIDGEKITENLTLARAHNGIVNQIQSKQTHLSVATANENDERSTDEQIAGHLQEKEDAIAAAKLPVKGMTFGNREVLLDSVPFEQASDAQQLRASIEIAMAGNPTIRVIRIRNGSLLDDDSMKVLEKMANKHDYQVWIERVDTSGKVGIVIEDGKVRGSPPDPAPE